MIIIVLFLIYLSTMAPVVYLGDSGELTAAAFTLGIPHNSGYPIYSLLGKIFCLIPLGNVGFRMNLMSSLFATLTILFTYSLIFNMTSSRMASFAASFYLAFTPLFWSQTVSAEVYTLHSFFVILLIWLLWEWDRRREFTWLILLAFAVGLSFCNHLQTVMLAPPFLFIILSGERSSILKVNRLVILLSVFLVALLLYIYLPIRTNAGAAVHWGDPNSMERFFAHVGGKSHRSAYVLGKSPMEYLIRAKETIWLICSQFGVILFLSIWGWLKMTSVRWKIFFILAIVFDISYTVFLNIISLEVTAFAIPTSMVMSILAGLGISRLLKTIHSLKLKSTLVRKTAMAFCCVIPVLPMFMNYGLCDQSRNYTAYEHAMNIFRTLDNDNILLANGDNNIFPLVYGRFVERMREEVALFDHFNIFFKMPYLEQDKKVRYGKWEELIDLLEEKIIEKKAADGVYFAGFNPHGLSLPDQFRIIPLGSLSRIIGPGDEIPWEKVIHVWDYYSSESLSDDFFRDYMNREVTAFSHFQKGKFYFMIGKPEVGLPYIKLSSEIAYNDEMLHSDIALFLTDYDYYDDARSELEKASKYCKDRSGVYNNWGYYFHKLGKYDEAIEAFQKAITLNPDHYDYYNNLAFSYLEIGNFRAAEVSFKNSLRIKDKQPKIKKIMLDYNMR